MRWAPAVLLVAAVTCISISLASARPTWNPPVSKQIRFDFKTPGSAKAELGLSKLARIHSRSKQRGITTVDALANQLETEKDLGVDLVNERLVYACSGLAVEPDSPAAAIAAAAVAAQAVAAQAARPGAVVTESGTLVDAVPVEEAVPVEGAVTDAAVADPAVDAVPVEGAVAKAAAADPAAVVDAVPIEGAVAEAAVADPAAGAKHHHHHHRHLLQAGTEWVSTWKPENPDIALTQAQTFSLHSRPGATRKIFLDFDGHTTSGSAWNSAYTSGANIITPAFDTDGFPNSFTASELATILAVWRGVAEDYAPFDVDITTEEPTGLALNLWVRCVIGGSSNDWLKSSAGGIAYVGVWGSSNHNYQPAFVFPKQLGPDYAKYIWEAASHEVGHNMGLSHDGVNNADGTVTGYYSGHAGWAPIMGAGYYQPLSQWSKGEYPGANQLQDDITIIADSLTFVAQTHGMTYATATPLVGTPNAAGTTATVNMTGIIRNGNEFEVMTFTASGSGSATLQVLGMPAWSGNNRTNVMMNLTVINAAGAIVSARTGPGIGAHSVPVAAGATYYITLNGIGQGVATSNTGYSNYGARGQYEMVLTYPVAAVPPPPPPATPSPSPSPQPPSPSPSPKPANLMKITSFVGSRTSGYQVTCTFTITVVDSSSGARINTPSLSGQWTSKRSVLGWPYSAKYTGSSAGVITAQATKTLSSATGNGCTFTVISGSLTVPGYTGYTMDPSSIKSGVMSW